MRKTAKTKRQKKAGLKEGYSVFPFDTPANRTFNMYDIPYPVHYQGFVDGGLVDQGMAYPGEEFQVYGDNVVETPMMSMQLGGGLSNMGIEDKYGFDDLYQSVIPNSSTNVLSHHMNPTSGTLNNQTGQTPSFNPYAGKPNEQPGLNKVKWSDVPIASTAFNLYQGIFNRTKEAPEYNRQATEGLGILRNMNYTPNYNPIRLSNNRLENQIRNSSSSVPSMLANMQNQQTNINNAFQQEDRRAQQMNNQYQGQYAQALMTDGQRRAAERARVTDRNQRHGANADAHIGAGLSSIDQVNQQRRGLDMAKENNRLMLANLVAKYPNQKKAIEKMFPDYFN